LGVASLYFRCTGRETRRGKNSVDFFSDDKIGKILGFVKEFCMIVPVPGVSESFVGWGYAKEEKVGQ
jgi:hypothetical protein